MPIEPEELKINILNPTPTPKGEQKASSPRQKQLDYQRGLKVRFEKNEEIDLNAEIVKLNDLKIKKPSKYGAAKLWTLQNLKDWAKEATTSTEITAQPTVAAFSIWKSANPSKTVLLWSHGMQRLENNGIELLNGQQIPPRRYAFVVEAKHALNTLELVQTPLKFLPGLVNSFVSGPEPFMCQAAPDLWIYPHEADTANHQIALQTLANHGVPCDILSFLGLPPGVEAIKLSDLLRSIDTGQDIQYMNRWDNYLLVTCRSVPDPKTGAVGVAPSTQKYADGNLYPATIGSPSLPGSN